MTARSAALTLAEWVTSATVRPCAAAAARSMWSEPTPAVMTSLSLIALAMRSAVRRAGQHGWEMQIDLRFGQRALEDEVRAVCVRCGDERVAARGEEAQSPSAPETSPRSSPGRNAIAEGEGRVWPSG